ncbi:MAG: hypothetical protein HYS13_06820 [Planctomycetia bacterium]|nr:hypothetical protein [Planctomycetia bacterium]
MNRRGPSRCEVLGGIVASLFGCLASGTVSAVSLRPRLADPANSISEGLIVVTSYTYDVQGNLVNKEQRFFVEGALLRTPTITWVVS